MAQQSKISFISRVLHDLQAPARHVKLFSELLRDSLGELDDSSDEYLSAIERAGVQMQSILESLRNYLKLPEQAGESDMVDVGELISDCWERLGDETEIENANLSLNGSASVRTDRKLLTKIVTEALQNAVRFRRAGQPLEVACALGEEANRCSIEIADNGVGVEPEFLDRVLQPFECLPAPGVECGVGLGLAMCVKVAELLGGTLALRSDGVNGASITFAIPHADI